jgi:hypothetical protein
MTSAPLDATFRPPTRERPLYASAALVAALIVLAGFAPTYYLKGVFATRDLDALRHVHGAVMTTWFALFFVQARLVATRRIAAHRQVGVVGIFVAMLVVAVGISLGIAAARAGVTPVPGVSPLTFLVLPIGEMFTFSVLFVAAIALRRRAEYHKRLMLLATLAMLAPAFARFPAELVGPGGPVAFFGLTDLVIAGCIAYDSFRNRRMHPAFAAGVAVVVVSQVGRLVISGTPQWMDFAGWLVS